MFSKKAFSLPVFIELSRARVTSSTVEYGTSRQLHIKKNQRKKSENFEKNVKLSSNFGKYKFEKIKTTKSF